MFVKKTWKNRVVEFAGRRLLTPTEDTNVYDVTREEGTITEQGDAFNASNMNDLETRIEGGISDATQKVESITLTTTWIGSDDVYEQEITITGSTENTKVDLQPDATTIQQLIADGVLAIYVENDEGVLTCKAIGGQPTTALTIQCTITEVEQ